MGTSFLSAILGPAVGTVLAPPAGLAAARTGWDRRWRSRSARLQAVAQALTGSGGTPDRRGKVVPASQVAALLAALVGPEDEVALPAGPGRPTFLLAADLPAPATVVHPAHVLLGAPPPVVLLAAAAADAAGNLFTGPGIDEVRALAQVAALRAGVVVAEVEQLLPRLPRVDVPGEWVDFVVPAPGPARVPPAPAATGDPAQLTPSQILLALLVLRGAYARCLPAAVYHDDGSVAAAVELLLPAEAARLGLKGRACTAWAGRLRPTLIPAVEAGVVQHVLPLAVEPGMADYVAARPDAFPVDTAGQLRVDRALAEYAALTATDLCLITPLFVDADGGALLAAGELPAPVAGADRAGGTWLVLAGETFGRRRQPCIVQDLAAAVGGGRGSTVPVAAGRATHLVTEVGVAYLHRCADVAQRQAAIRAVAGYTPVGLAADPAETAELRRLGIVALPVDLEIDAHRVSRELLAARHMRDLVDQSAGLYRAPARFRHW